MVDTQSFLPPMSLFKNEKTLTGNENRFFNDLLCPKQAKHQPNTLIKPVLQNLAITRGDVQEYKRLENADSDNLKMPIDDEAFWEDFEITDYRTVTAPNEDGSWN